MRALGVIPARHGSTRFPGKPLAPILGRPMVQWVHERASRAIELDEVVVATDDERVAACVRGFGGRVVMTSPDHASGTDRVAEVARGIEAASYVNIQGDEPLIDPDAIDIAVRALLADDSADWSTLAAPLLAAGELADPSVVKVVTDERGRALYFSRAPIPWDRSRGGEGGAPPRLGRRHVGLYALRRKALADFTAWGPSPLELCESLEQLRALEHGARIVVAEIPGITLAVDHPRDVPAVEARLRALLAGESAR